MKTSFISFMFFLLTGNIIHGQDLMDMLEQDDVQKKNYVTATFKSTRLVNGHTIENPGDNQLIFLISHRFESIKGGFNDLFGIDYSYIRFGFEYGIDDRLSIGLGRTSFQKLYDGFVKYRILSQSTGQGAVPVSATYLLSTAVNAETSFSETVGYKPAHRFYYVHQLLIARKFNTNLSLQMMPTLVHRNLVKTMEDDNTVFALGMGGRYKITKRFTVNCEYYFSQFMVTGKNTNNPLSVGFDIETGGHVFQLLLSNSKGVNEKTFITETTGKWTNTDIHFGFNIFRYFSANK